MRQISPKELAAWLNDASRPQPLLLDVREPWEFETCHIAGASSMPMRSVPARYMDLDANQETVVICHHGARSFQVGMFLSQQGFSQVINLAGGVDAWANDVDPAMPKY